MERAALVTGNKDQVEDVGRALAQSGWGVISVTDMGKSIQACGDIVAGSVGAYVQLPWHADLTATTPLARAAQFLSSALVARFEIMSLALPALRPDACVVLVEEDGPGEVAGDVPASRHELLRALARSVALGGPGGERKAVVLASDRSPDEIAHVADRRGEDRRWLHSRITGLSADLDFADWRREVLLLTTDM